MEQGGLFLYRGRGGGMENFARGNSFISWWESGEE